MQPIIAPVKARDLVHVRRADQSPIERVCPRVIWTLNYGGQLAVSVFNKL